jgi:hypothetical protein
MKPIPTCINKHCGRPVMFNHLSGKPRPHCNACQKARWKTGGARLLTKKELLENPKRKQPVAFHQFKCTNTAGHLGWKCPTGKLPKHIKLPTDLDHKDGNGWNNVPNNVEELCKTCHTIKGRVAGDVKGWRY